MSARAVMSWVVGAVRSVSIASPSAHSIRPGPFVMQISSCAPPAILGTLVVSTETSGRGCRARRGPHVEIAKGVYSSEPSNHDVEGLGADSVLFRGSSGLVDSWESRSSSEGPLMSIPEKQESRIVTCRCNSNDVGERAAILLGRPLVRRHAHSALEICPRRRPSKGPRLL